MTTSHFRASLAAGVTALALTLAGGAKAQAFNLADRNNDMYVTLDEAQSIFETLTSVHFRKFDSDGDRALSRSEYAAFSAFADIMYEN